MKISTRLIAVVFILTSFFATSQTLVTNLKKKNLGIYQGEIPSYNYLMDTLSISVDKTLIEILLTDNAINITIGRINKKGSYHILFKGKDYYVIDAFFEGDILTERLVLNEKRKTIMREGSYPQPNATLKKSKK
jgi:hypothetical protein